MVCKNKEVIPNEDLSCPSYSKCSLNGHVFLTYGNCEKKEDSCFDFEE